MTWRSVTKESTQLVAGKVTQKKIFESWTSSLDIKVNPFSSPFKKNAQVTKFRKLATGQLKCIPEMCIPNCTWETITQSNNKLGNGPDYDTSATAFGYMLNSWMVITTTTVFTHILTISPHLGSRFRIDPSYIVSWANYNSHRLHVDIQGLRSIILVDALLFLQPEFTEDTVCLNCK
jgi:hypothetical protein